jgi:gliding motility-associated lipoprotein GldB
MKKYILFAIMALALTACEKKSEVEKKIEKVAVAPVKIERFDKLFFETKPEGLPKLKQQFPFFFPPETPDGVWLQRMNEPFLRELYTEVEKKYNDLDTLETDIEQLLKHVKYYYPKLAAPRVITMVNDDQTVKSVYKANLVIIPLSLYLGKTHKFYVNSFDAYQLQQYEPSQILPDIVTSFSEDKIAHPADRTLLSLMVYYGKLLYLKDLLLPDVADNDKIGYTKEQLKWAQENGVPMWTYFVENKLFYSSDPKLPNRFVNPAPFSKFGMEWDNDSPGRLGQYVGWQIVKSYMENNKNVTLQQLLAMDARTIFDKSKYKPNK